MWLCDFSLLISNWENWVPKFLKSCIQAPLPLCRPIFNTQSLYGTHKTILTLHIGMAQFARKLLKVSWATYVIQFMLFKNYYVWRSLSCHQCQNSLTQCQISVMCTRGTKHNYNNSEVQSRVYLHSGQGGHMPPLKFWKSYLLSIIFSILTPLKFYFWPH